MGFSKSSSCFMVAQFKTCFTLRQSNYLTLSRDVRICDFSHTRYRRVLEHGIYSALGRNCQ